MPSVVAHFQTWSSLKGPSQYVDYAHRLVFGTDICSDLSPQEARIRAGIAFRWLETDDTFRVPPEADFLLGPPEDGIIRGMALPEGARVAALLPEHS